MLIMANSAFDPVSKVEITTAGRLLIPVTPGKSAIITSADFRVSMRPIPCRRRYPTNLLILCSVQ